jgi:hypothetical protein
MNSRHLGRRRCRARTFVFLTCLGLLTAGCVERPAVKGSVPAGTLSQPKTTLVPPPVTRAPGASAPTASATTLAAPPQDRPVHHPTTGAVKNPLAALASLVAARSGRITAALYDRVTGQTWVLDPGVAEDTASIVKLEILGANLNENESTESPPSGETAGLMAAMIEASDNDAATALWNIAGGPQGIANFDQLLGMTHTTPSTQLLIPGTSLPGWGLTTTTARDQLRIMRAFAYGTRLLTPAAQQYGVSLMENVEAGQNWGVSFGVTPGTTIALKNGWLPLAGAGWQVNSVGWISGHGRNYVLAVLTDGSPSEQYGIDSIQEISASVFDSLG